jgi:hypothetical protein
MGILDDAIREHLELKRQHGAEESELEGLEAEAFGPADRPDAVEAPPPPPDPGASGDPEAETRIISPGSSVTAPAGEGDQLDKVFEAKRLEEVAPEEEPSFEEHELPPADDESNDAGPTQEQTAADPVVEAPGVPPETAGAEAGDDAGDALERERQHLAGQPTEHYDVDAAIAEEDEIDLLSESSLSEELDRALEGPGDPAPGGDDPEPEHEFEPETAAAPELEDEAAATGPDDAGEPDLEDAPDPDVVTGEVVEEEQPDPADAEFFDQDDPLEGTPDFLEETPEHDRLWFEQKEPKDFDFGD